MTTRRSNQVRMIPIDQINVLNPRGRGKKKFAQITGNIAKLGLKRPVTVSPAEPRDGEPRYDLVCGQGRMEAFKALGQLDIPALVVEGTKEELLLMSLAENLARRQHSAVELVREIRGLKERGYPPTEIAVKTALTATYIRGILQLLDRGEERLLHAVEKGQLPINVAITIAISDDKTVQRALQEAYEQNDLRGKALIRTRRLIELRRTGGKRSHSGKRITADRTISAETVMKTFQQETLRQKMVVQKAKICETRLLFAVSAIKQLFRDEHFLTLLRAEGLDSLPQFLVDQVREKRGAA